MQPGEIVHPAHPDPGFVPGTQDGGEDEEENIGVAGR